MRISIVLTLLFAGFNTFSQKLIPVKIGEEITLKISSEFVNMSHKDRMEKIASSKIPLATYSTESQEATLSVNDNPMQWTSQDTDVIYGFYKASVNALFDEVQFIQDGVKEINGREFIVFEFVSTVRDDNVFSSGKGERNYTYIQYTSFNDKVLLFNFGCPARMQFEWEDVAEEMMQSIRIK